MTRRKKPVLILLLFCLVLSLSTASAQAAGTTSSQAKGGKFVQTSSGTKYRMKNGKYAKGTWLKVNGKYYYFQKNSLMARNKLLNTGGKTYYVNRSGVRVKSMWLKKNGKTYYFDKTGAAVKKKWVKRGSEYYYLGADGTMVTNRWVGSYYVDSSGKRLKRCIKDGYYLNRYGKKVVKVFNGDYIFVGDSRTVGMQNAIAPKDTLYIAKVGEGYDWLKETGGVKLRYHLTANPDVKVVLGLGVNDLGNINQYISYYKKLIRDFPTTEFYILSVNPVQAPRLASYYKVRNKDIEKFNKKLYKAFGSRYINTYNYMTKVKYKDIWNTKKKGVTRDGLHYTSEVYEDLYRYITRRIR